DFVKKADGILKIPLDRDIDGNLRVKILEILRPRPKRDDIQAGFLRLGRNAAEQIGNFLFLRELRKRQLELGVELLEIFAQPRPVGGLLGLHGFLVVRDLDAVGELGDFVGLRAVNKTVIEGAEQNDRGGKDREFLRRRNRQARRQRRDR